MKSLFALLITALLLSGCVRDNGTATFDPITDAQYREAHTNEQAR